MAEQQPGIPHADCLFYALATTSEHSEHHATIIGGAAPLPLNKT